MYWESKNENLKNETKPNHITVGKLGGIRRKYTTKTSFFFGGGWGCIASGKLNGYENIIMLTTRYGLLEKQKIV